MQQQRTSISPNDPLWTQISELDQEITPTCIREALARDPQLADLKSGRINWLQSAQPGGILDTIRTLRKGMKNPPKPASTLDQDFGRRASEENVKKQGEPKINYVHAISYLVCRHAEEEFRPLINCLRRPLLTALVKRQSDTFRSAESFEPERIRLYQESWQYGSDDSLADGVPEDAAIQMLRELASRQDHEFARELDNSASEAEGFVLELLESGLLPWTAVHAALRAGWQPNLLSGPTWRQLLFAADEHVEEIIFPSNSPYLQVLFVASRILAEKYQWVEAAAGPFLLCGSRPVKKCAKVTYDVRTDVPCCSKITIEVDPTLTVPDVAGIYKRALAAIGAEHHRSLKEKNLALACEGPRSKSPRKAELAANRLLHPRYKIPEMPANYPSLYPKFMEQPEAQTKGQEDA